MNITELKEKLLESVDVWADARIDDMVKANPMLAIPSVYMKRAAHNIISKNKEQLVPMFGIFPLPTLRDLRFYCCLYRHL